MTVTTKCRICGEEATHLFRCDEHNRCDDCGAREKLCHYKEATLCDPCYEERVRKQVAEFDGDTKYTSEITCPHCGYVESDSWEFEESEYECGNCGGSYQVQRIVIVEYSTYKVDAPAAAKGNES